MQNMSWHYTVNQASLFGPMMMIFKDMLLDGTNPRGIAKFPYHKKAEILQAEDILGLSIGLLKGKLQGRHHPV